MTPTTIILGFLTFGMALIAWKLFFGTTQADEKDASLLREMLEGLRRDLSDTKDKLTDRMGKNAEGIQERLENTLKLVNQQLGGMDKRIDTRVSDINTRLDAAAKMMSMVQKQYGTVESLSGDIKRMQEAFKAPKPRGIFSEKTLVDMVSQMLPHQHWSAQHTFSTGAIVDLMIQTADGKLCIDAKFPLENYARLVEAPEDEAIRKTFRSDVKKHIKDIAKKYILPEEGTLDFALIYVPSDAVMYEILTDPELAEVSESSHVSVVSPHSFYYFLHIILQAYQSQQFAENAKQILSLIRGIQQQSGKLGEELSVLQKHIGNAASKMGDVTGEHARLDMHIAQANQLESGDRASRAHAGMEKALPAGAKKAAVEA